jgi:N-acetylglutamate synthase/N-acetylornithine aminotransferase
VVKTAVFGTAGTVGNVIRSAGRVVIEVKVEMENL